LKDVQKKVAVPVAFVRPASNFNDILAGLVIDDEASVLLLYVFGEFETVNGERVLEFMRHFKALLVRHLKEEDVVLKVLLLISQLQQHVKPFLYHQVSRVILLLLRKKNS
jgi:hypothetical protein